MEKHFGDRKDGYRDRSATGVNNILIDLKPNRCNSDVYMNAKIDVTNFVKFLDKLKKEDSELTYFHGMAFVIAKAIYSRPLLNRFICNRTMYMHNDVSLAFVAKAQFNDESLEYLALLKVDKDDNLLDISKKIKKKVAKIRQNKHEGGANGIVDKIGKSPKLFRMTATGMLKFLDKRGWLPKSVMNDNIYYSSAILSNIGTFKVGAIYHNLTNFGTSSSLITFGEIYGDDRKYMEIGVTIDERIADGFYFCKALKLIEYLFDNPELLLDRAGNKVSIPKEVK